ncbi:MAG: ABC transporter ATP-binding protein [Victivallaceae bacterium]
MLPILQLVNISKSFPEHPLGPILSEVNLEIFSGITTAITGNSGNGKSTLLQIAGLLDLPDSGKILFQGKPVASRKKFLIRNRYFGFIFQNFLLIEDETVLSNVLMPALIARQDLSKGSFIFKRGLYLLERVGISAGLHKMPARFLSGGEKQRVALARALINSPLVVFADEPSGNLDAHNSSIVHELLLQISRKEKVALILVTHNFNFADSCDVKFNLNNGKLS